MKTNEEMKTVKRFINRKHKLLQRIEDFEKMMLGMRDGYIAEAPGDDGEMVIYPEFTEDLIQHMTESIGEIRAYKNATGGKNGNTKSRNRALTAKEKEFYNAFFYLMAGISLYIPLCDQSKGEYVLPASFDAVFHNVRRIAVGDSVNKWYRNREELNQDMSKAFQHLEQAEEERERLGVLYDILCAYSIITGKGYVTGKKGTKKVEAQMVNWDDAGIAKWKGYFTDTVRFEKSIGTVLDGLFEPAIQSDLESDGGESTVTLAMEYAMTKLGITYFLQDDLFFPAYTYLNKAYNAACQFLAEEME